MPTIAQIKKELGDLATMSQLAPERFAEEGGLAEGLVAGLGEGDLKATQLRKVFHQVKDLQREFRQPGAAFDRAKVALIMPTLAYAVGRKLIPSDFYDVMKLCFGSAKCRTRDDFDRAASFLEAVMAYHKYHEIKRKA